MRDFIIATKFTVQYEKCKQGPMGICKNCKNFVTTTTLGIINTYVDCVSHSMCALIAARRITRPPELAIAIFWLSL